MSSDPPPKRPRTSEFSSLCARAAALRRELHAHPEAGFEEVWTSARVRRALVEIVGLDVCPMSKKCQSPQNQLHRLRTRQLNGFWANQQIIETGHRAHGLILSA